jgi:uroporphyrinogen-III synthase
MRILVTRPLDDSEATAAKLRAMGHEAIVAPLLEIRFRDDAEIDLENVQAILATSANGVRALERTTQLRDIPVFAVGPQTAEAAKLAGFTQIKNAKGDGAALAEAAMNWAKPGDGALFHAQGEQTKGGLADVLQKRGFEIRSAVLYEAAAVEHLPQEAAAALQSGGLDAAMFFSPRSARIFFKLIVNAGLAQTTSPLTALCISKATADALSPLDFRDISIAARPDQEAMLRLVAGARHL